MADDGEQQNHAEELFDVEGIPLLFGGEQERDQIGLWAAAPFCADLFEIADEVGHHLLQALRLAQVAGAVARGRYQDMGRLGMPSRSPIAAIEKGRANSWM
jgi:hypothetical protein